jgi:hypothetical protein
MAIASKGSSFGIQSGNTYTPVAALLSLDGPGPEAESFEARTLDGNAGVDHLPTGYTEPGEISGEMFLTSANKTAVLAAINNLSANQAVTNAQMSYGTGNAAITFNTAFGGLSFTPTAAMKDGVKAKFKAKASGTVT